MFIITFQFFPAAVNCNNLHPNYNSYLHISRVLVGAVGKASATPIASIVAANSRTTNSEPIRSTSSTATIPSLPQDGFSSGSKGCWRPCFHLKGANIPARCRRSAASIGANHAPFWLAARAIKMEDGRRWLTPNPQKHTLQSTGIWETLRKAFALDPNRSNGVPLNPYFRNPTPGGLDPQTYDDPVTIPAGDIADNAYWKRDVRRSYPQLSVVNQGHAVSLLTVGSAAKPKVELIGEAGEQALVAAQKEGETGLAAFFEKAPKDVAKDVFVDGLPPLPSGQTLLSGAWDVHKYELIEDQEQTYGDG